jgi:hypothetical protein
VRKAKKERAKRRQTTGQPSSFEHVSSDFRWIAKNSTPLRRASFAQTLHERQTTKGNWLAVSKAQVLSLHPQKSSKIRLETS